MRSKFAKNYIYNVGYQVLGLLVSLVTVPYVSRILGASSIGDYSFTSGIVSYFAIVAVLGTPNYAQKEIAYFQSDYDARSRVFWEILLFRAVMIIVTTIGYIAFLLFSDRQYHTLYSIQLITIIALLFDFSWLFQGMEDFKTISVRSTVVKMICTACIFIFVKEKNDLSIYALIMSLSAFLGNLLILPKVRKYIKRVSIRTINIKRHIPGILIMFSSVVSVQVYTVLDKTMLGIMVDTTQVGYYAQAQKLVNISLMMISSFAIVLLPRMAALFQQEDRKGMERYIKLSFDYLFFLSIPISLGTFLCAEDLVLLLFGNDFIPTIRMLRIICVLTVITGAGQIMGNIMTAINRQLRCTVAVLSGAVTNMVLNFFLIRGMSGFGACIASVIAESVVTGMVLLVIVKMISIRYIVHSFLYYLIPAIVMGIVIVIIHNFIQGNIIKLFAEIVFGILVYFLILILKKDRFVLGIIHRFRKDGK